MRARACVHACTGLGVCVAQLDGDVALEFALETDRLRRAGCTAVRESRRQLRGTHQQHRRGPKCRTCTPDMALTTVDLPCATWPIVPMLSVAWREITSSDSGVRLSRSSVPPASARAIDLRVATAAGSAETGAVSARDARGGALHVDPRQRPRPSARGVHRLHAVRARCACPARASRRPVARGSDSVGRWPVAGGRRRRWRRSARCTSAHERDACVCVCVRARV